MSRRGWAVPGGVYDDAIANREAFEASQKQTDLSNVTEIYLGFEVLAIYGEAFTFTTEPERRFVCTPWQAMPGATRAQEWTHPDMETSRRADYRVQSCPHCNLVHAGFYVG